MSVRTYDTPNFLPCPGDISLGGALVTLPARPTDMQVELLVQLPGQELRLQGDIIDVLPGGPQCQARVKFSELAFQDELAIARFLDNITGEWDLWKPEAV